MNRVLLGRAAKAHRMALGMNVRDAGAAMGMHADTVSRLERGNADGETTQFAFDWLGMPEATDPADARLAAYLKGHRDALSRVARETDEASQR